jgi:hypothetical protein
MFYFNELISFLVFHYYYSFCRLFAEIFPEFRRIFANFKVMVN